MQLCSFAFVFLWYAERMDVYSNFVDSLSTLLEYCEQNGDQIPEHSRELVHDRLCMSLTNVEFIIAHLNEMDGYQSTQFVLQQLKICLTLLIPYWHTRFTYGCVGSVCETHDAGRRVPQREHTAHPGQPKILIDQEQVGSRNNLYYIALNRLSALILLSDGLFYFILYIYVYMADSHEMTAIFVGESFNKYSLIFCNYFPHIMSTY